MFTVRRVSGDDFEKVYPLLQEFNNPNLAREDWNRLFRAHWPVGEDYFGHVLLEGNRVVGYMGLLFSRRELRGAERKLANLSSWIIQQDYRGKGLIKLLLEQLVQVAEEGYTITVFTPTPTSQAVLAKGGFEILDRTTQLLLPLPGPSRSGVDLSVETDPDSIAKDLDPGQRKILDDHRALGCKFLRIRAGQRSCFVVLNRIRRNNVPFGRILYVDDIDVLLDELDRLAPRVCLRLRILALAVSQRYLKGREVRRSLTRRKTEQFRSSCLEPADIDSLYSEIAVLQY